MERENKQPSVAEQFQTLLALEPTPVAWFVADDATRHKEEFLGSDSSLPERTYSRLDVVDFEQRRAAIAQCGRELAANPGMNPKFQESYGQFVQTYLGRTEFTQCAWRYNHAVNEVEKAEAAREYMRVNIELYGSPDEATYRSLLSEKIAAIRAKSLTGKAKDIADELYDMVDVQTVPTERYAPSEETVEWMHTVADSLYGGMLSHVPDKPNLDVMELQGLFTTIISEEFGEAAQDWQVVVEKADAVKVKAAEKQVIIPENAEKRYSSGMVRKLIVHELGVHMLRAVSGGELDLDPLKVGLPNYLDAEEGLGVVMEQALQGAYAEAGVDHYITAGLAYHDAKNFREIFEVKWRLALLGDLADSSEVTNELIEKKRKLAYGKTNRIMRGTDELPWFKDLSYYNGAKSIWQHLEAIRGDDLKFMFVLMGKANPAAIDHERLMYEATTV